MALGSWNRSPATSMSREGGVAVLPPVDLIPNLVFNLSLVAFLLGCASHRFDLLAQTILELFPRGSIQSVA